MSWYGCYYVKSNIKLKDCAYMAVLLRRWSMFGLSVGLLTEFATGVYFPDQLKIIVSNLGIADVDF